MPMTETHDWHDFCLRVLWTCACLFVIAPAGIAGGCTEVSMAGLESAPAFAERANQIGMDAAFLWKAG